MLDRNISLVSMGQGNMIALKRTLDSFSGIVDEVVYGDVLIFPEDRNTLSEYAKQYNINVQRLPFNYIFQMGFSSVLNLLISNAKNDLCLYMNTGELIDENYGINSIVSSNIDCNTFYFTHREEKHRWHRLLDRRYLRWSGYIHEEVEAINGELQPHHKPIFMMKDSEKDMDNSFKAAVANAVKELTYFQNYSVLVDFPKLKGGTNDGWVKFAQEQYQSMQDRMNRRGKMLEGFRTGNIELVYDYIYNDDEFKNERFESSHGMNFQGARKDIL